MCSSCIILVDKAVALTELCGLTILERLLRNLSRCGINQAIVLADRPDIVSAQVAVRSRARPQLSLVVAPESTGEPLIETLLRYWPDAAEPLLVISGNTVFDSRLLRSLLRKTVPTALIDSTEEARHDVLVSNVSDASGVKLCGAAVLSRDWANNRAGLYAKELRRGLVDGSIAALDVAEEPRYDPTLRRSLRPFWFPAPAPEHRHIAGRVLLDSTQKGALDFPAYIHAPIEKFLVSKLCKTAITPHQLTIAWVIAGFLATICFARGDLLIGIICSLFVGIVDGLDGKQARLKVEMTPRGKLEHQADTFFEAAWPTALACHFYSSGELPRAFYYLALRLVGEVLDGLAKKLIYARYQKLRRAPGRLEKTVRFFGGQSNTHTWTLAIGTLYGAPSIAFIVTAWWEMATAVIDLSHAAWNRLHLAGAASEQNVRSPASRKSDRSYISTRPSLR